MLGLLVTAPPRWAGFETNVMVLSFFASSSYCGNRMLSVQLHGKQLVSAPEVIFCHATEHGRIRCGKINRRFWYLFAQMWTHVFSVDVFNKIGYFSS